MSEITQLILLIYFIIVFVRFLYGINDIYGSNPLNALTDGLLWPLDFVIALIKAIFNRFINLF